MNAHVLEAEDAAAFDTFAVPRYLSLFGTMVLEMIADGDAPRIAHLCCRTGYPDRRLSLKLAGATIDGFDPSAPAIELASAKAATLPGMKASYTESSEVPSSWEPGSYDRALTLHPLLARGVLPERVRSLATLVKPGGQVLVSTPMRGSFGEIGDLFREYAVKANRPEFAVATGVAERALPSKDGLVGLFEEAGLGRVEVEMIGATLRFPNARAFFEEPAVRLLVLADWQARMELPSLRGALAHMREAIDKYWSDGVFELGIVVGCAVATKRAEGA